MAKGFLVCRSLLGLFVLAYLVAFVVFVIGTFGWFDQARDPLAGVFLIPLGLPWNLVELPDHLAPFFAAGAPLINIAIIWFVCRSKAQE